MDSISPLQIQERAYLRSLLANYSAFDSLHPNPNINLLCNVLPLNRLRLQTSDGHSPDNSLFNAAFQHLLWPLYAYEAEKA